MTVAYAILILAALRMAASLAPLTDERRELALATAREVAADDAFYANDPDKIRTLALHMAVAYREGGFQTSAVGDKGTSFCAYQIHESSGGTEALTRDADACARKGHRMLRSSIRVDRNHPVAWYARGPRGFESEEARSISDDRVELARRLVLLLQESPRY